MRPLKRALHLRRLVHHALGGLHFLPPNVQALLGYGSHTTIPRVRALRTMFAVPVPA